MKKLCFFLVLLMALGFWGCKSEAPTATQLAAAAAKEYYGMLLAGKYREFAAGYNQPNRLPDGYHDQLVMNAQMFVEQQQDEHKGIDRVNILTAKADTVHHVVDVFLQMVYGDSTREQVVVPMVEVEGEWKMR